MRDEVRAPGHVTLVCRTPGCGWGDWLDPLDPKVEAVKTEGHLCEFCTGALIRHTDNTVTRREDAAA